MASIFTYDTDLSRVSSPWLTPADSPKPSTPQPSDRISTTSPPSGHLSDYGVTRLEAEPQEGPTEYKLHLLLRPRRNYSFSTTSEPADRSQQHKQQRSNSHGVRSSSAPILAPSNQSRQTRLEHLTTQLLWRLQQSSPYHTNSANDLVLPKLPEASSSLQTPSRPGKLLAGLEESRGALYEIGVSDDGTFVGLTKDEMDESLTNLRAMAASLGCNLKVLRMVVVGECEWQESTNISTPLSKGAAIPDKQRTKISTNSSNPTTFLRHQAQLWVAEALITPDLSSRNSRQAESPALSAQPETESPQLAPLVEFTKQIATSCPEYTEQLRVTLTGPTTSGKSSLLGTLSTATLDNGRGKSRLSLLKHRHEIASGVTSSVTQELLGYKGLEVKNYASGNVSTWTDIHASAEKGRLVLMNDSAGHPRYRRTTVRGLVGWAPHWTFLCVAADDAENAPIGAGGTSSAQDILGTVGVGIDLAKAHLELCLKLDKPLVIVITKLELASRNSLRQTLSKILSVVKGAGRVPSIFPPDNSKNILESDFGTIIERDDEAVSDLVDKMTTAGGLTSIVPILMTSAAKGTGVRSLHALLRRLPIPPAPTSHDYIGPALNPEQPACLFHIEDIFGVPASYEPLAAQGIDSIDTGVVIAGHLRFGELTVKNRIVVGPFPAQSDEDGSHANQFGTRSSPESLGMSLSHDPSSTELARVASHSPASVTRGEWHNARIVSLRNLRLPVHTLKAGQVGTMGIVFDAPDKGLRPVPRIRKGMVVAVPSRHMIETGHSLQAASGFTASFEDSDVSSITVGSLVVVYIASVRASARVSRVSSHEEIGNYNGNSNDIKSRQDSDDVFALDVSAFEEGEVPDPPIFGSDGVTELMFEFMTNREWIELGSQILVMPGGGQGLYYGSERGEKGVAGLEGFVGRVVEVED